MLRISTRDKKYKTLQADENANQKIYRGIIESAGCEIIFGCGIDEFKHPRLTLRIAALTRNNKETIFNHKIKPNWRNSSKNPITFNELLPEGKGDYLEGLIGKRVNVFVTQIEKEGKIDNIINKVELI